MAFAWDRGRLRRARAARGLRTCGLHRPMGRWPTTYGLCPMSYGLCPMHYDLCGTAGRTGGAGTEAALPAALRCRDHARRPCHQQQTHVCCSPRATRHTPHAVITGHVPYLIMTHIEWRVAYGIWPMSDYGPYRIVAWSVAYGVWRIAYRVAAIGHKPRAVGRNICAVGRQIWADVGHRP